jgi:hypothetical protein
MMFAPEARMAQRLSCPGGEPCSRLSALRSRQPMPALFRAEASVVPASGDRRLQRQGHDAPMLDSVQLELGKPRTTSADSSVTIKRSTAVCSQNPFVQRDDLVASSRRQLPTQRSATPFCHGA